jgi:hypothetical protein
VIWEQTRRRIPTMPWMAAVLMAVAVTAPLAVHAQSGDVAAQNGQKARAALDAMVQALGGDAWLNEKNVTRVGHIAAFFHGQPDVGTEDIWEFHQWPDKDRFEVTKHRDVVEFFVGRQGWEVTYRGKRPIPPEQVDDALRRRDHSIEVAVKVWLKDPNTILVYEGTKMAERRMAEQVTLISPQNDSITIQMDEQTHLPLSRSFQWRDPLYKDKDTYTEEYDDYHTIDGLPSPFSITRLKNDEMVRQFYVTKVEYNRDLPGDFWDVDATARRIKK